MSAPKIEIVKGNGHVPHVEVFLNAGEAIRLNDEGSEVYRDPGIQKKILNPLRGGLFRLFRLLFGGNVLTVEYSSNENGKHIAFTPATSGVLEIYMEQPIIVQKGNLLLTDVSIQYDVKPLKKFSNYVASGLNWFAAYLRGSGRVIITGPGGIKEIKLQNQTKILDTSHVIAFDDTFEVKTSAEEFAGWAGGENISKTSFTGTGRLWVSHEPDFVRSRKLAKKRSLGGLSIESPSGSSIGTGSSSGGGNV